MEKDESAELEAGQPLILRTGALSVMSSGVPIQKVLKAHEVESTGNHLLIAGASPTSPLSEENEPPTITLEKSSDHRIHRISVECPCGRHAEVLCEYEPEEAEE